jgi:hypothetical protein
MLTTSHKSAAVHLERQTQKEAGTALMHMDGVFPSCSWAACDNKYFDAYLEF